MTHGYTCVCYQTQPTNFTDSQRSLIPGEGVDGNGAISPYFGAIKTSARLAHRVPACALSGVSLKSIKNDKERSIKNAIYGRDVHSHVPVSFIL